MEWEILLTEQVEGFLDDLYEAGPDAHRLVDQAILERNGPAEGRPLVDATAASRITNVKDFGHRRPGGRALGGRLKLIADFGDEQLKVV